MVIFWALVVNFSMSLNKDPKQTYMAYYKHTISTLFQGVWLNAGACVSARIFRMLAHILP
jgi:hypothetical protein